MAGNNSTSVSGVTDSSLGLNNVMTFTNGNLAWSSVTFSTSVCWENTTEGWKIQFNPSYITSTGISGLTAEIANIQLYSTVLTDEQKQELEYSNFIPNN